MLFMFCLASVCFSCLPFLTTSWFNFFSLLTSLNLQSNQPLEKTVHALDWQTGALHISHLTLSSTDNLFFFISFSWLYFET